MSTVRSLSAILLTKEKSVHILFLASKNGAEIFFVAQTDAPAMGDDNDLVVQGVIDIRQSCGAAGRNHARGHGGAGHGEGGAD
jgi:hypothetical protein